MGSIALSWNLILSGLMHYFSSCEYFFKAGTYPFKKLTSIDMLQVQSHFRETIWDFIFKNTKLSNIKFFWNLIPHFNWNYCSFRIGRGYLPEVLRQIKTYLPEVLQQIRSYLPEVSRQIRSYLPEPFLSCAVLNCPMQSYLVFHYNAWFCIFM